MSAGAGDWKNLLFPVSGLNAFVILQSDSVALLRNCRVVIFWVGCLCRDDVGSRVLSTYSVPLRRT